MGDMEERISALEAQLEEQKASSKREYMELYNKQKQLRERSAKVLLSLMIRYVLHSNGWAIKTFQGDSNHSHSSPGGYFCTD